jgi:hypothetical protein
MAQFNGYIERLLLGVKRATRPAYGGQLTRRHPGSVEMSRLRRDYILVPEEVMNRMKD